MFKYKNILVLATACMFIPTLSFAQSSNITAKVVGVGIHGNGRLAINLTVLVDEPACAKTRVDIMPDHPQIAHIMSVALSAQAMEKEITVRTNGCTPGYPVPTLDNTDGTWFFVLQ